MSGRSSKSAFGALLRAGILLFSSAGLSQAQQFGPPAVLSDTVAASDSGNDYSAITATDGVGNWVAVWESDDTLGGTVGTDRDIFVARSSDDGATWTAPAGLKTTSGTDTALGGK